MAHDDGYDNSFSYDTENDDLDKERISESLTCKKCAKEFIIGTKGSSELKELCSQCYAAAVDDLLLVEKEVTGDTASDSSNLKDKEVVEDEGKVIATIINSVLFLPTHSQQNEDKVDGDDALNETQNYTDANGVDVNSKDFLRLFFTDETSVSMQIGGEEQLYTQKKFHHGPHRCFLDLEVRSVLPLLLNYYLLSAIAMEKERVVFHSRCWIEHKALRRRYILLAILRSKCLHVRYDFILLDPDGNIISLLCGISKMAPFVFLPDVPVDHAAVKEILSRYICDPDNKLALIPGHPDKDEYGHFIVDGFDPLAAALDGGGNSKRKRTQRQVQQGDAVDRTTAKTKTKAKPQTKAKRKSKAKPQAKPQVKKPRKGSAKEVRNI
jgi:hypothetical protein